MKNMYLVSLIDKDYLVKRIWVFSPIEQGTKIEWGANEDGSLKEWTVLGCSSKFNY